MQSCTRLFRLGLLVPLCLLALVIAVHAAPTGRGGTLRAIPIDLPGDEIDFHVDSGILGNSTAGFKVVYEMAAGRDDGEK